MTGASKAFMTSAAVLASIRAGTDGIFTDKERKKVLGYFKGSNDFSVHDMQSMAAGINGRDPNDMLHAKVLKAFGRSVPPGYRDEMIAAVKASANRSRDNAPKSGLYDELIALRNDIEQTTYDAESAPEKTGTETGAAIHRASGMQGDTRRQHAAP